MTWTIAFDADDTLWHNENLYSESQQRIFSILQAYAQQSHLSERLLEAERRNLQIFGYGVKGFTLSMIETAIEVSAGRVTASEIQCILDEGKSMLRHQIELLPGVEATLRQLQPHHNLMLITKGDLFHQESRIATSGLAELFAAVEVVSEKNEDTYQKLFTRYHLNPDRFVMVGNSVRSDILPVMNLGARCIYIPYQITWELEEGDLSQLPPGRWVQANSIEEVPGLLSQFGSP